MSKQESTTRKFDVTRVRWSLRHKACRGAVLTPIFGRAWTSLGVEETLKRLRRLWYKKLVELEKAGWSRVQSRLSMQYMRNCPPFGVHTEDKTRVCRLPILCPFCYARLNVLDSFMHLEAALFGSIYKGISEVVLPHPRLSLVAFTRVYPLWPNKNTPWSVESRDALIYAIRKLMSQQRQVELDVFRPLGGIVLQRADMQVKSWPLLRSGVFLCDSDEFTLPKDWEELKNKRLLYVEQYERKDINKTLLAEVIARRFSYQAGILSRDADDVVAYLNGMKGARTLTKYGICRRVEFKKHFLEPEHGKEDEDEAERADGREAALQ